MYNGVKAQTLEWVKPFGSTSTDIAYSVATDATGNIYTTGFFQETVDFDPSAAIFNLTSVGSVDVFISKFDSAGNFVWAKQLGGSGVDIGNFITIDASGNTYTTGRFNDTADFDPGTEIFNLTSSGSNDIFISKLDSAGNFVWAKKLGGNNSDYGQSIITDTSGNVYTTGLFEGTVDFDPNSGTFDLTSVGDFDIFVSKLDSAGNFVWAIQLGGILEDGSNAITIDDDNIYITGYFQLTVDFDPSAGTFELTSEGAGEIFVLKLDTTGNFVWAKQLGGTNHDIGQSITTDDFGNVYTTGYFAGTADFDPGSDIFNLTSASTTFDIFVSKLDSSGNFL